MYPQLQTWNALPSVWLRRLSLTNLIHYSGKNAVFLPPERMLPLVRNEQHAASMSSRACARAIERRAPEERARLLAIRTARAR